MTRREARILAMQLIFEMEGQKDYSFDSVSSQNTAKGKQKEYINDCLKYFTENRIEIDNLISSSLDKWTIDRISKTDLAVMRLAVTEMKWIDDVPAAVAINEAVELAKEYGTENSGTFVNGVLGKVKKAIDDTGN